MIDKPPPVETEPVFSLESDHIKPRFEALFSKIEGLREDYDAHVSVMFSGKTELSHAQFQELCNRLSLFEAYFTSDDKYFFDEFERIVDQIKERRTYTTI